MRHGTLLEVGFLWLTLSACLQAQLIEVGPKKPKGEVPKVPATRPEPKLPVAAEELALLQTIVEVDILSPGIVSDPNAQRWGKQFEELGLSVRIRNGRDLTPGVSEKVRGSLRYVSALGLLNRDGELTFGQQSFRLNDPAPLKAWLDEIKAYGAQGAPDGQPLWGLNRAQFEIVQKQMTRELTLDAAGKTPSALVQALQDQLDFPLRIPNPTVEWLKDSSHDREMTCHTTGFSMGTGLAIAFNEVDMGLRPMRSPNGDIYYELWALEQLKKPWPMGWEPDAATPRNLITPELFKKGVVGFDESPLADVMDAIAQESHTPIVIDTRRCLERKIDIKQLKASYPSKEIAWALVVSQCARQAGLYNYYRQDEAGRGFVLIAPFEIKAVKPE